MAFPRRAALGPTSVSTIACRAREGEPAWDSRVLKAGAGKQAGAAHAGGVTTKSRNSHLKHNVQSHHPTFATMKGYLVDEDIPLDRLSSKLRSDAPEPKAKDTEVIVDVYSSALNFFDILQVAGKYQIKKPFPYVPGTEIAGVIAKDSPIPEGCSFKPGDRVFGAGNGSYAEKVSEGGRVCKADDCCGRLMLHTCSLVPLQVPADHFQLLPVPAGMNFDEASSLFITYPTSYAALVFRAHVQEGETVLVHAGAGGVGLAAIQIAKALGAVVIATAGSDEKLKVCKEVGGADHVINYRDPKWPQKVKGEAAAVGETGISRKSRALTWMTLVPFIARTDRRRRSRRSIRPSWTRRALAQVHRMERSHRRRRLCGG